MHGIRDFRRLGRQFDGLFEVSKGGSILASLLGTQHAADEQSVGIFWVEPQDGFEVGSRTAKVIDEDASGGAGRERGEIVSF